MSKRTYTADERAAFAAARTEKIADLKQRLAAEVAAIQNSDQFRRWLRMQAKFHRYSFRNVMLILAQCPDATEVAGYTTWRELGRQVRKGESSICIFAPMPFRAADDDGEEVETRVPFKVAHVFDIAQTDPIEGKAAYEPLVELATNDASDAEREALTDAMLALANYAKAQPWQKKIDTRYHISSYGLSKLVSHIVYATDPALKELPREIHRTIAEAVGYIVCCHVGVDIRYHPFKFKAIAAIAKQEDGGKIITDMGERIQALADVLLTELEQRADVVPLEEAA